MTFHAQLQHACHSAPPDAAHVLRASAQLLLSALGVPQQRQGGPRQEEHAHQERELVPHIVPAFSRPREAAPSSQAAAMRHCQAKEGAAPLVEAAQAVKVQELRDAHGA